MSKKIKNIFLKTRHNPEWIAKKSEQDRIEVQRLARFIKSYDRSYSNHITLLGNFARHDIKNAIQTIDSILSTTEPEEFTTELILSLKEHLNFIRSTNDNFAQLIPYSTDGTFTIDALLNASRLLHRADMEKNGITIVFDYPADSVLHINHPFQSLVQMINNLIINSMKSLDNIERKKILVEGEVDDETFTIRVFDNGLPIPDENIKRIFEFGFTTTGGSGTGLFHANYLCNELKGSITMDHKLSNREDYNKVFIVKLPLRNNDGEEYSDN